MAPPKGVHHLFNGINQGSGQLKDTHYISRNRLQNIFYHYLTTRFRETFATPGIDFMPNLILDIRKCSFTVSTYHRRKAQVFTRAQYNLNAKNIGDGIFKGDRNITTAINFRLRQANRLSRG